MNAVLAIIGLTVVLLLGIAAIVAVSAILNGWVLTILWGWFVVPTFHLPTLSLPVAIGVALVISYLTHQGTTSDPKYEERSAGEKFGRLFAVIVARPLVVLLFGWVVHLFM